MDRFIAEKVLAGYWEWDFNTNTVTLSQKFKQTFGYTADELDDKPETIRGLIFPESLERFDHVFAAHIYAGGVQPFTVELRYRHKNGKVVWVNCTGTITEWDHQRNPIKALGCHVDISEIKEASQRVGEAEQLVEEFFDLNLDMLCIMDEAAKFIRLSPRWEKLFGYRLNEMKGRKLIDFVHPEDLPLTYQMLAMLRESGEIDHFSVRYRCKDGSYRHIEWHAIVKNSLIYASARDISIRVNVLREITQLQKLNSGIINTMSEGVVLQSENGNIVLYNQAAEIILGPDIVSDNSKNTAWKAISEDGTPLEMGQHPYMEVLSTKKPVFNRVMGVSKPNNELTWILANSVPLTENNKISSILTTFTDITELKHKEVLLYTSLQTMSEQKVRLEQFAHIVSHNLRTHSGNIESLIGLAETAENPEEKEEYWQYLKKASGQLMQTISDLNEIIDAQKPEMRKVILLREHTEKVLESLVSEIKHRNANIKIDIPDTICLEIAPAYLESILMNLITNGMKYRHPQREIEISIRAWQDKGEVIIKICDNGVGIDMEKYGQTLFGMYKTFHGNTDAKGIGLFITKKQVEDMGGRIEVQSEVGKGTCFIIRFGLLIDHISLKNTNSTII